MKARLGLLVALLLTALLLPGPATASTTRPEGRAGATRVLAISVDGLNTDAIRRLGPKGAPALYRLIRHGAATLNARTEHEQTVTLPNHTSMMTSRRIDRRRHGHGVTWDDDRPGTTVQGAAGHAVASVFTAVHDAGGATALFSTKEKFGLYDRSWPAAIDRFEVDEDQAALVRSAVADLRSSDRAFTFLHVSLPDRYGHQYGGMSRRYLGAVRATDRHLMTVLRAISGDAALRDRVVVVLTADHGFAPGTTNHSGRTRLANYRIPFLVWGAGVRHANLYRLNPDYRDPGRSRPTYAPRRQPVRNGDLGNLATDLLGLPAIPGSTLDARQDLDVR